MFSKEVRNCTVGVVGLGRIGRVAAQIFHGMGATVIGQDVFQIKGIEDFCTQVELDEVLAKSDIVTIHAPYIKENGALVTRDFLKKMKDGAILINCARGQLVNTEAGHRNRKPVNWMAGCDVLDGEAEIFGKDLEGQKLETRCSLVALYPKVLITPHLGSNTDEAVKNMVEISFENLKDLAETKIARTKSNN